MASWRLHDVQDPQSADPAKTTSQSFARPARISGAAGVAALALRRRITALTPYFAARIVPISSASRSKFAFRLSRKPTIRPASDPGSDGTRSASDDGTPTGLRTRIWLMTFSV